MNLFENNLHVLRDELEQVITQGFYRAFDRLFCFYRLTEYVGHAHPINRLFRRGDLVDTGDQLRFIVI